MLSRKRAMLTMLFSALGVGTAAAADEPAQKPAAPPKDPQASFEPRGEAGAGQKWMERSVGDWDVVKTISPPGKDPVKTTGTCRQRMVHGGKFLRSEFVFNELDGTKTTGEGLLGFDPVKGVFSSVWTDSRSTRLSLRQSEGPFDGESVALYSRTMDNDPNARKSRTVAKLEDGGKRLVHRQYNAGPDGREFVIMELALTRTGGPAADKGK
jgi:hypothetical protein